MARGGCFHFRGCLVASAPATATGDGGVAMGLGSFARLEAPGADAARDFVDAAAAAADAMETDRPEEGDRSGVAIETTAP